MGTVASSVRDAGLQRLAFSPPPCGYSDLQCDIVFTARNQKVAMQLFTPTTTQKIPATVDETKERWKARLDYDNNTRMLCIFSHGNADDIATSAPYSQWMADTFDMNVARIALAAALRARFACGPPAASAALRALVYPAGILRLPRLRPRRGRDVLRGGYVRGDRGRVRRRREPHGREAAESAALGQVARHRAKHLPRQPAAPDERRRARVAAGLRRALRVLWAAAGADGGGGRGALCTQTCCVCCVCRSTPADGENAQVFMPSVARIPRVVVPVCIVHGTADDVVPVENAETLVAALGSRAAYPALYVPAGHNDIEPTHGPQFVAYLKHFLEYTANVAAPPYRRDVQE